MAVYKNIKNKWYRLLFVIKVWSPESSSRDDVLSDWEADEQYDLDTMWEYLEGREAE